MTLSPSKIAEQAMPGWRAVEDQPSTRFTSGPPPQIDRVAPDMDVLRRKYLGTSSCPAATTEAPQSGSEEVKTEDRGPLYFVVLEPRSGSENRMGHKVAVVSGNRVVAVQG